MECYTCHTAVPLARKVWVLTLAEDAASDPPKAFCTAFVCQPCYECLDTVDAIGLIDGRLYRLHDTSRFGKAPLYTAEMFDDYQRAEAVKLGAEG
jgi:hypothetical protein